MILMVPRYQCKAVQITVSNCYDRSVASRGLHSLLASEIPKASRAAEDRSWPARSHPTDQQGKPAVGCVPDPWRTLDAGVRGCSVDGLQIHGARWDAAFAKLEDISSKPRAGNRRH